MAGAVVCCGLPRAGHTLDDRTEVQGPPTVGVLFSREGRSRAGSGFSLLCDFGMSLNLSGSWQICGIPELPFSPAQFEATQL